jgi:hypothetical protein
MEQLVPCNWSCLSTFKAIKNAFALRLLRTSDSYGDRLLKQFIWPPALISLFALVKTRETFERVDQAHHGIGADALKPCATTQTIPSFRTISASNS